MGVSRRALQTAPLERTSGDCWSRGVAANEGYRRDQGVCVIDVYVFFFVPCIFYVCEDGVFVLLCSAHFLCVWMVFCELVDSFLFTVFRSELWEPV